MIRPYVVTAVFKRNFGSYFSGVIGYLFIVVFVMLGAFLAFRQQFFTNNLANLDQLNEYFPQLLLFLVPAITMGVWAEEKKLGTDELLFTLPVSDLEVLLGKYFAVVAVYTVALAFSLTHTLVLWYIGNPDWGLLATTYIGYWLAGSALLSCGMVASYLTSSSTVAFVLGAVACAIPVFIGQIPCPAFLTQVFRNELLFEQLSLASQFRPFGMGLIPLSSVLYFASLTGVMLYINSILIGHRHWADGPSGSGMSWQFVVRAISVAIAVASANAVLANFDRKQDMTTERLFTITPTTMKLLSELDENRPVTIQAFISRDVPREYVPVRTSLIGLLGQYQQASRGRVSVRLVTVEPFSPEADQAKQFGIESRRVQSERGGRVQLDDVFLGAVINSGANEVVVPFFDVAIPIEYELTRSVRTAAKEQRRTVGILETDAKVGGGFDMSSFRSLPEWRISNELKKQYTVETVSAAGPIDESKFDVLIAVLPSSLTQNEMTNFVEYVKKGKPTLIFDDPLPATNPSLAPKQPKPKAGGMMGGMQQPEPKADGGRATSLVNLLGIQWNYDEVVFDNTIKTVHPEFADVVRPEMISVTPKSKVASAFSPNSVVTSGLQEVLLFFSGTIRPRENSKLKFEPLLRTGKASGLIPWSKLVRPGFFGGGIEIVENPPYKEDDEAHTLAAEIHSAPDATDKINVIYVADSDMIADWFFTVRERKLYNLDLDNVTFVLNAVDALASDEAYIPLRKRRAKHRTLVRVEGRASESIKRRSDEQSKANDEAQKATDEAKQRLKSQVEKIRKDSSLDDVTKVQMLAIAQENESRRLQVEEANIEQAKQKKVDEIKARSEREIRAIENSYFLAAVAIPPIPAILLGIWVWFRRLANERRDISATRRRKV